MDKVKIDEFVNMGKNALYGGLDEIDNEMRKTIEITVQNASELLHQQIAIPNISITANNKFVELSQLFNRVGLSMFFSLMNNYGEEYIASSFLGNAIISDLLENVSKSLEKLAIYGQKLEEVTKNYTNRVSAIQEKRKRNIFARVRSLFVPVDKKDLSLTDEEIAELDRLLQDYKDADSQILNYNLEDNLIPALVKEIAGPTAYLDRPIRHRHRAYDVPGLLEECVIPDLKILGLEHLIPQLQEALVDEYKKDIADDSVEAEYMDSYIPNFAKKENSAKPKDEVPIAVDTRQARDVLENVSMIQSECNIDLPDTIGEPSGKSMR